MSQSQHINFYLGVNISNLWVNGFHSSTSHDLILIALIVAAVCFLKTALSALLTIFSSSSKRSKRKTRFSRSARIVWHLLRTIAITLDYVLGYLLMFAFMVANVWLCITIILSSMLSYFLTHWSRIRLQQKGDAANRREDGESEVNCKDTEEATVFLQKRSDPSNTTTTQGCDAGRPDPLNEPSTRQTIVVASPGAPLVSFHNLYDRPTDVTAMRGVDTAPPDVVSAPVFAGPSSSALRGVETKPRSDSNPLLEKYPLLKFHNVDIPDGSPSHRVSERGLQIQELDKLISELQS